jgi:hypothetical protein
MPLANDHLPSTTKPPSTGRARPLLRGGRANNSGKLIEAPGNSYTLNPTGQAHSAMIAKNIALVIYSGENRRGQIGRDRQYRAGTRRGGITRNLAMIVAAKPRCGDPVVRVRFRATLPLVHEPAKGGYPHPKRLSVRG